MERLNARQVAEILGISYISFRKNPLSRRPTRESDGSYLLANVLSWRKAKLEAKQKRIADSLSRLLEEQKRTAAELDSVSAKVAQTLPRLGFRESTSLVLDTNPAPWGVKSPDVASRVIYNAG